MFRDDVSADWQVSGSMNAGKSAPMEQVVESEIFNMISTELKTYLEETEKIKT